MSWLVAPRWTAGVVGRRRSPRSRARSGMTGLPPSGGLGERRRRRRTGRRRRPRRSPSAPAAGISPTSAWAPASAASASSIACDPRRAPTSAAATGPRATRNPNGVRSAKKTDSSAPWRRMSKRYAPSARRAGDEQVRGGRGSTTAERRVGGVGRGLAAEVDARDDPVEQPAGEDRHDEVRRLGRAVAASATAGGLTVRTSHVAVGSGGAAGERAAGLPRLDDGVGHGRRRRRRRRCRRRVIAPGSSAATGWRSAGSARARWRNGPTVCDGVSPSRSARSAPRTASPPGRARRCRSGTRAPTTAR